ncbi:hypothetical protein [Sporosarcina sp. SAFN-015]|uniref:hypothetical protein n=1 Tax=Sporosarcina sp. SAFN-015 TaxID=3387274 RepID=UPI003F80C417
MGMTVKKKVLAGAISVGLLSGVGMAFANTDAGGALKSWYDGKFGETLLAINSDVSKYAQEQLPGLKNEYNGMKTEAETDINNKRDSEIGAATTAITNAKASRIASVESTKDELIDGAGLAFYNEFLKGYFEIQEAGDAALAYATTDLTAFTGEKGQAAIEQVTNDLTAAKDAAVTELEEAIRIAKEELTAELATQQEINTRNLKNRIDWKIDEVRGQVEGILADLVATQEGLIATKAAELEAEAIAALDEVVSSINE